MTEKPDNKPAKNFKLKLTLLIAALAFGMWFILWSYVKLIGSPTVP